MTETMDNSEFYQAAQNAIELLKDTLKVNTIFIASNDSKYNTILKSFNREKVLLEEGEVSPFNNVLCKLAVEKQAGALVIPSLKQHPATKNHPITETVGDGCFLAVPISKSKNQNFGTLCAFDVKPYYFNDHEIRLIETLGGLLSQTIELKSVNDKLSYEKQKMVKDLKFASNIQEVVLPTPISTSNLCIQGYYYPAETVGGDMYVWKEIKPNQYAVFLADVMGHGLPSSLISMSLQTLFQETVYIDPSPRNVLNRINQYMSHLFSSLNGYYCTGVYLLIDMEKKTLQYINAGHPAPIIFLDEEKKVELPSITPPLGMFFDMEFTEKVISIEEARHLFLYTDGLTELFTKQQLSTYPSLIETVKHVVSTKQERPDDICMILVDFLESN